MTTDGWQFLIDRGGTFTDVIGVSPDGREHVSKLLSADPDQYRDAAAEGIRRTLAAHDPGARVAEIRMGTTVATNALLERKGARTGVVLSAGFGDTLIIGNQDRPALFDLHIRKPLPLFAAVAEAQERLDADGSIVTALQPESLRQTFAAWRRDGIESVAVCLLHAWLNPVHERAVAALANAAGFDQVYLSHEVSPLIKLVSRAGTTVADAYLSPVLLHYVGSFSRELQTHGIGCDHIYFMQSHGGLVAGERFRGKDAVLSGPAGGVVGMRAAGAQAGISELIGFDMGGTSTDVAVCAGEPEIVNETEIGGVPLRAPMIRIHTIAAGGGSVLSFAQGRFQAGPESAGAWPGPLCYGRNGPLALTDANVLLGRIRPEQFPAIFGTDGRQPLNTAMVREAFDVLAETVSRESGQAYSAEDTAEGFLRVAVDNMANAVRHISVSRGLDPARYTLCCFGGAGAQFACRVADQLGIRRILLDPLAGVLSARGMGAAPLRSYRQQTVDTALRRVGELATRIAELRDACRAELRQQNAAAKSIQDRVILLLRAPGSDTTLQVPLGSATDMRSRFASLYRARFGLVPDNTELHDLEIESIRVEADSRMPAATGAGSTDAHGRATTRARAYLDGAWREVDIVDRATLQPGARVDGPAIITEAHSTTVLEAGWTAGVNSNRQLLLERRQTDNRGSHQTPAETQAAAADPVMLEIINNRFVYIADEMGTVLRNTARSVNIKERLDFSCALFTADGELIANAPHVPVHLGSMDDSVQSALRERGRELRGGAVVLSNAPYNGGTHLPDITAISAVPGDGSPIRYLVASRAHHADVGGITPGSMPPFSRRIEEEGALLDNFVVAADGRFYAAELRERLGGGDWPARNPDQNIADFRAQIAANERGKQLLAGMFAEFGNTVVEAYSRHVQDNAEAAVRAVIDTLGEGEFRYALDNGQQIAVRVSIDRDTRSARIDFSGTAAAADNNLNAPRAVCQAAVMYVFRTLVGSDIPLNAGCRRPLQLRVPPGSMLDPAYPAAVVGGNVETSQNISDALYGALGVLAASQGTMNNLSFGNDRLQYYETIAGGAGAGDGFDGASAVQTHMTNTRITDTEIIESRFPVRVREFSVRRGSGGNGRYRGGDGVVRKLEFRETMRAAILSQHRTVAPFGLAGGGPGQTGDNCIERADGTREPAGGALATEMAAGDILIIMTPGGGGYGPPGTK